MKTTSAPSMPPVKTVPPGTPVKPSAQEQLYTLVVTPTFVQIPVRVKDRDGRLVDGLLSTDFTVKENGTVQKLKFFTADPFALSVAIVLDTGMSDLELQTVQQTFPALVGAFAPYDEVAIYTYSSTVSQVTDFGGSDPQAGRNPESDEDGTRTQQWSPPVLSGPLGRTGRLSMECRWAQGRRHVNTPSRESHVFNDAILQAALDLRKRDRTRRKIIFVISDGHEMGSKASYRDVLQGAVRSNEIQVKAVSVGQCGASGLRARSKGCHMPQQGYDDILPRYVNATGGAETSRTVPERD